MPQDEARAILGVSANADEEAIRSAHRRLVSAVHPDKGGSAELTRRINAARDTLLRRSA
jgi:CysZ protein